MTKIVSIFSASPGEGKRTISQNISKLLGENNQRVLYVELDYYRPSFAKTTGLYHPTKNFLNYMLNVKETQSLKYQNFITNTKELAAENKKALRILPSTIDFLTLPMQFEQSSVPKLVENDQVLGNSIDKFAQAFVEMFKDSKYDVVIFMLPHMIESIFTVPIIRYSDLIFNIVTTNPTSLIENQRVYEGLLEIEELNIKDKWNTLINKYNDVVPRNQIDNFLQDQNIVAVIPFDPEKIANDLTVDIGAELLQQELLKILRELSFDVAAPKERGFFGKLGKIGGKQ